MQLIPTKRRRTLLAATLVFLVLLTTLAATRPASAQTNAGGMVGAVGCSQTNDIFGGIYGLGVDGFWSRGSTTGYSGGALYEWAEGQGGYWSNFSSALASHPQTTDIWIELCLRNPDHPSATAEDLAAGEAIVAQVRELAPSVTVWVSPYNDYVGVECVLAGPYGYDVAEDIADHLVSTGQALAGPDVGPLTADLVGSDGCHANVEGGLFQAQQVIDFFYGDGSTGTPSTSGDSTFADISGSVFESDIEWLAAAGITSGCNPPANTLFCPYDDVTRGQMAAFLHRALPNLPEVRPAIDFIDDDDSPFESDIEWLYSRGIADGTSATTYDPVGAVTRGQMAAFLVRAFGYEKDGGGDLFVDDDGSVFESEIDRLGFAGITSGCNPPVNDMFCPNDSVTRAQMAAFLHRAVGG